MSYPDSQPPLHGQPFMSSPFSVGDEGSLWQPLAVEKPSNLIWQFDHPATLMNSRTVEYPSNFPPAPNNSRMNPPSVPGVKSTSHIFYKTRLCTQFRDGTCRNGENCTFAHGNSELRHPPPNWQELVREKDRKAGNGSWGDDQRMVQRIKICNKYYNGEECPYGDKCNFVHERPPQAKKPRIDTVDQRETSAINIGVTIDARGTNGTFEQPVSWKTKICSKWEMGICTYGDRCSFAHGQSDLRLPSATYEPESTTNTFSAPRKTTSFPTSNLGAMDNLRDVSPPAEDEEQERTLRWKLNKKINRIYADWFDNMSPPTRSPAAQDA